MTNETDPTLSTTPVDGEVDGEVAPDGSTVVGPSDDSPEDRTGESADD